MPKNLEIVENQQKKSPPFGEDFIYTNPLISFLIGIQI